MSEDGLKKELKLLVQELDNPRIANWEVIDWASPVLAFGDLPRSVVATLGINPSDQEFMDTSGIELTGGNRRFHTLKSLGLNKWSEASENDIEKILNSCINYFSGNPYDTWFKRLEYLIQGTGYSYYFPAQNACHLDLVPYATSTKWAKLTSDTKRELLKHVQSSLGKLIKHSPISIVILNGKTIIDYVQQISNVSFTEKQVPEWTLPRTSGKGVSGYSYEGKIRKLGGVDLEKEVLLLGYNHNIQSSFGVTSQVQDSIRNWINNKINGIK